MGDIALLNVKTARIPPLPLDRWPAGLLDEVNGLGGGNLQAGRNVFCTLANYPRLFVAWMQLGVHALGGSSLGAREREMVILRTTALAGGRYPFAQHVEIGLRCGLNRKDVAALLAGPSSPHWRGADRRLLKAVDELKAGNALNDATWDELRGGLSVAQCMDVAATVAFYRLAAWLLNACRTPLEDGQQGIGMSATVPQERLEENAYAGEPRILPVPPEDWPPALLEETAKWPGLVARPELRNAGVYVTFANHPALFQAIGGPAVHILNANSLPDRAREVAIIRACARARGAYPYRQHVGIGRSVGVAESEIAALSRLQPTGLGGEARLLVDMVDGLYRDNNLDDSLWARAQVLFSNDQIMDVILICGFYGLISAVLNVARTSLEPGSDSLPEHFIERT
ncbi:MAG: carboxymuconolactone decarboxylase family protein [Gammaproteobacteria bacterium]|nr:carboxymuconolactone decarboxylase family protein [Gammaproteobacteria bacterium]MDE0364956.1 carboxymuconolactone decarboxylase family protein [Gammaproteobacteria bacterium]